MQGTPMMETIMAAVRRYADSDREACDYNACWNEIERQADQAFRQNATLRALLEEAVEAIQAEVEGECQRGTCFLCAGKPEHTPECIVTRAREALKVGGE